MDRAEQLETEARLREALEQAKASYDRAKWEFQKVEAAAPIWVRRIQMEARDWRSGAKTRRAAGIWSR
jgi:hypothetical protein